MIRAVAIELARIAALLGAVWIGACSDPHPGLHGETLGPRLGHAYNVYQIDRGLDLLEAQIGRSAGYFHAEAFDNLRREGAVMDGLLSPGPIVDGIAIRWSPGTCLADTALLYEAAHAVLCHQWECEDEIEQGPHARWAALVNAANDAWRPEICL